MNTALEERFRTLINTHGRSLHFFVLRHVGAECDAQDIAQEALASAAAGLSRFRGEAELSTWVFGIARHLAHNHVARQPHRRHGVESDDVLEALASPWPGPCDQLMQRQSLREVSDALLALAPGTADALVLVTVDGLSYEEAARQLGVTAGTVRSRVSRGRATMRHRLGRTAVQGC